MNRLNGVVTFANGGRLFTSIPPLTLCRDLGIIENTNLDGSKCAAPFFLTFRQIKPLHHSEKKTGSLLNVLVYQIPDTKGTQFI